MAWSCYDTLDRPSVGGRPMASVTYPILRRHSSVQILALSDVPTLVHTTFVLRLPRSHA